MEVFTVSPLPYFPSTLPLVYKLPYSCLFLHPDIDECYLRLHECSPDQICTNTDGSHECACPPVFITLGDPITCASGMAAICVVSLLWYDYLSLLLFFLLGVCPMDPCEPDGSCSMLGSTVFCTCSVGEYCDGICEGTFSELDPETQTCIGMSLKMDVSPLH